MTADDDGNIKLFDINDGDLKQQMCSSSTGSADHMLIIKEKVIVSFNDKYVN